MAVTVQVAGLATIKIALAPGTSLLTLGFTVDGARITTEGHAINIPGDENGGDEGPPVDIQYLGETARVRLELTKFDATVATMLEARFSGGTAGMPPTAGGLVFAGSGFFRLLVHSPTTPMNFPCAVLVRTPVEINKGTKYSRMVCEFECYKHPATGVLWNGAYS